MTSPMQSRAQPAAAQTLFTLRILFMALTTGVVVFGAFVIFVLEPQPRDGDSTPLLTVVAVAAVALVVAWLVVTRLLRGGLRARVAEATNDEAAALLPRGFFNVSLIGAAMAEAFSFLALVVYMITASQPALLAAGLGLLALVLQMPSADRFQRFAEEMHGHSPS